MIIMDKQIIFRFILPVVILSGIFAGAFLNFLSFLSPYIINPSGSWIITDIRFAELLLLAFLAFAVFLFITIRLTTKVNKQLLIIGVIFTGFTYIYMSITWNWVTYFIIFVMSSAGIGFITPFYAILLFRALPSDKKRDYYLAFGLLTIAGWIICFYFLFNSIGVQFWRLFYIIIGGISVLSSISIIYFKGPLEIK